MKGMMVEAEGAIPVSNKMSPSLLLRGNAERVLVLQRGVGDERDGLGAHHARQEPADEPGARGRGDAVKVSQTEAGAGKRLFGDEVYTLGMGAGGDVGDDAPEGRMQIGLAPDDRGEDGALTFARADHGGGGLVAA